MEVTRCGKTMKKTSEVVTSVSAADTGQPWSRTLDNLLDELGVSPDRGLDGDEIRRRRSRHGGNRLRAAQRKSVWTILLNQFKSLIVILLGVASLISFFFGEWMQGIAIAAALAINTILGFAAELQAVRSMESLRKMGRVTTRVRRDGQVQEVRAEDLVPGDIILLEGGDVVTADARLIEASKMQCDESALTGESVPAGKESSPVDEDAPLAERRSMLFKGTAVTRGSGEAVVVATGMETELGGIARLVEEEEEEITPLEQRLERLGRRLIWVTLGIAAVTAAVGIVAGKETFLMIETGIALAVAAIPEGLPIVATIALARGMWRMARRHTLVNKLSAVETLGATSLILTDKTGTLTENRMGVAQCVMRERTVDVRGDALSAAGEFRVGDEPVDAAQDRELTDLLQIGVLCNNATLGDGDKPVGDPMELALLAAGAKAGIRRAELLSDLPEKREVAFDPARKMMATYHRSEEQLLVAVKGAAEAVVKACRDVRLGEETRPLDDEESSLWLKRNRELAGNGLRVLALASKQAQSEDEEPYEGLTLHGLVGLIDPPRKDVAGVLEECRNAGLRVVMVTGDQPETARKVAT
ncbi:MAG: HAD-IC family P-type ATPase, partial [Candidatus Eisenbacteria bacterium]|nr:HAD-IC family P-type ATPase [Candidatus Eisenbacteria bacterium]